jgi:hypothetical protein
MVVCTLRDRLTQQWKDAAALYVELSAALVRHVGRMSKTDYDNLRNSATQVGKIAERFQSELEQHTKLHGCGKVEPYIRDYN